MADREQALLELSLREIYAKTTLFYYGEPATPPSAESTPRPVTPPKLSIGVPALDLEDGEIDEEEFMEAALDSAPSIGHCNTMGTASTMGAIAEALGFCLPGASSIPAMVSEHMRMSTACGRRAVDLAWANLKPSDVLSRESFENAITVDMAVGGSTNAIVHVIAMARRAGFATFAFGLEALVAVFFVLRGIVSTGQRVRI